MRSPPRQLEQPLTKLHMESLALELHLPTPPLHLLHLQKTTLPTTTQALGKSLRHLPLVTEHLLMKALARDLEKDLDWMFMERPQSPLLMLTCPLLRRQGVTGG